MCTKLIVLQISGFEKFSCKAWSAVFKGWMKIMSLGILQAASPASPLIRKIGSGRNQVTLPFIRDSLQGLHAAKMCVEPPAIRMFCIGQLHGFLNGGRVGEIIPWRAYIFASRVILFAKS